MNGQMNCSVTTDKCRSAKPSNRKKLVSQSLRIMLQFRKNIWFSSYLEAKNISDNLTDVTIQKKVTKSDLGIINEWW